MIIENVTGKNCKWSENLPKKKSGHHPGLRVVEFQTINLDNTVALKRKGN